MVARVLVIGGYGHFGSYIVRSLAADADIRLLVGGRSVAKAQAFIHFYKARPSGRSPSDRHRRDALYASVARNRYRWFGRTDYCARLTPEQRARLL